MQGGRVGVGHIGAKASQGPLTLAGSCEDDYGRLRVVGRIEVLLQELAPTKPQVRTLPWKLVWQLVELGQECLHRGVLGDLLGRGGWFAEAEYEEAEQYEAHDDKPCSTGERPKMRNRNQSKVTCSDMPESSYEGSFPPSDLLPLHWESGSGWHVLW